MAKEKKYTKAELEAKAKEFLEKGKLNKTTLSLAWMDSYVAKLFPDRITEYVKACAELPTVNQKRTKADGTKQDVEVKDIEGVRKVFIEKFFPDFTEEAIEKRKAEEKAQREAKKAEKKRREALPLEEQLAIRLKELAEEE